MDMSAKIQVTPKGHGERTPIERHVRINTSARTAKTKSSKYGLRQAWPVELDFDRLVSSIESSIMADQDRTTAIVGITPQELLIKSNPALYSFERELTRDLTNPREMYSILSHTSKSTEDLTAKFKQEIVRNIHAPGMLPKLSRTTTLNEIGRLRHGKFNKHDHIQSDQEMLTPNKKLNLLVVTRHKTNLESFRTIKEGDKGNLYGLNLPKITRTVSHKVGIEAVGDKNKRLKSDLPSFSADQNVRKVIQAKANKTNDIESEVGFDKGNQGSKTTYSASADPKLEKWFSEMPNEVFDKAQRAIMEASIKDKLINYQSLRNRKEKFPTHVNVLHGSRLRRVPNTFLEVRVDSFGKHLKNEERMNKYKLQQKSILKLKMRDVDEAERQEKAREDIALSARLRLQYRSNTTMTCKNKSEPATKEQNKDVVVNKDEKGLKTFNVNEVLRRDILSRERTHINNYQEYMSKSAFDTNYFREHDNEDILPTQCSTVLNESELDRIYNKNASSSDRGVAKTSVVTLTLSKGTGLESKHLPEWKSTNTTNMKKNTTTKTKVESDTENTAEMTDGKHKKESKEIAIDEEAKDVDRKRVTKIPTDKSSQTSYSNKSTISSKQSPKPNKSVLNRFNKLEVFSEHGNMMKANMLRNSYHGHKLNDHEPKEPVLPPSYKLDLKSYPQHFKNPIPDEGFVVNTEVRKQELVFRFEPGEVFISRKPNHNRASERARIIYGKVLNRDDKMNASKAREHRQAKDSHSAHSISTGLDGYKVEFGHFEQRALADSIPSDSVLEPSYTNQDVANHLDGQSKNVRRRDFQSTSTLTTTPQEFYIRDGRVMRDVALETDIIGSETDSLKGYFVEDGSKFVHRPESSLSDFIFDNNDGESLNSDSDMDEHFQAKQSSKCSAVKSRGTQSGLFAHRGFPSFN